MKLRLVLFICSFSAVTVAQQPVTVTIEDLKWLSGIWGIDEGERTGEEFWRPVINGKLEGKSTMKKKGKVTLQESMVIEQDSSGTLYYRVKPAGQRAASFKLIKAGPTTFIFENKKLDFPQRIIYERVGEDSLRASIEGMVKGKMQTVLFPYRRVIVNAD